MLCTIWKMVGRLRLFGGCSVCSRQFWVGSGVDKVEFSAQVHSPPFETFIIIPTRQLQTSKKKKTLKWIWKDSTNNE